MSSTTPQDFVVYGEHSMLYSAAGDCPDCSGTGAHGVDYSTAQEVRIVNTEVQE